MRTFTVRRTWMSTNLGGSSRKMIGAPSDQKRARHGYPHFLYLSSKYHPDSPKSQGVPGVFYSICDFQEGYPAETRVFVNLSQDGDYYYMGNYKVQQAAPLTSYEWSLVPARIRTAWTTVMSTALWAREIRIRITLRMQLAPGEELGMAAIEAASAQRDKYLGVTAQQIHQAIVDGQERIYVWCLKPVEYDEEFLDKLMGWVEDTERGDAPQF
ncbi:hypothetical protein BC629DRAFT_1031883 [Irpex lacteus]|nr:hypothetical protein BC629DRAFT_1031883 [Irpex lacteus]